MAKLQEKPPQREHPALQNMTFFNFFYSRNNLASGSGYTVDSKSGSTDPNESGSAAMVNTVFLCLSGDERVW
jgi:hypothetical protein